MPDAPLFSIDLAEFNNDPYPALAKMRESTPIAYVPELDAKLITRRDDIFDLEKQIDIFSSDQPEGLMTQLMGQNMMRKDGDAHQRERRAIFPTLSPTPALTSFRPSQSNAHLMWLKTLQCLYRVRLSKPSRG